MNPFAAALEALFSAPGSLAASYQFYHGGVAADPVRVIRSQPDTTVDFGGGKVIQGTNVFEIMKASIERPVAGDILQIGAESFRLVGEAMIDTEGLTWTIGAVEVA